LLALLLLLLLLLRDVLPLLLRVDQLSSSVNPCSW
jgi:hypothetical protein